MLKFNLPNIFTCCNLFSGCIGAVMVFRNQLDIAAYLVFLAAFFDLLDGMAARKGAGFSAFGKELDSLADVVSFGFVPGAIMFKLLQQTNIELYLFSDFIARIFQFFPFIIAVFSALRLARFNIDTRQTVNFIGLPVPANAILIVSLPLILKQFPGQYDNLILHPYFIIIFSSISSYLLVSELNLFSLKFKTFSIKENLYQYLLIFFTLVLFPFLLFATIPIIISLYIFFSFLHSKTNQKTIQ